MICLLLLSLLSSTQLSFAACPFPNPGTRMWNIVAEDLVIDCETLSKVSIIESLLDLPYPCSAIPIITDNPIISTEGYYCLSQNITGTMLITVDNVVIDLNNHVIDGGFHGIIIIPNVNNVTIRNGTIQNTTEQGILVAEGCSKLFFEDLVLNNCALTPFTNPNIVPTAIAFGGSSTDPIEDCILSNITISNCSGGILMVNTNSTRITNCNILSSFSSSLLSGGIFAVTCDNILFENCFVSTMIASGSCFGIGGVSCTNVTAINCVIEKCITDNGSYGFTFDNSSNISLINCTATEIETSATDSNGFRFSDSQHLYLDQCITQSISSLSNADGFNFRDSSFYVVKNCSVSNITIDVDTTVFGTAGFNSRGENKLIEQFFYDNCTVSNIRSLGTNGGAYGFVANNFQNASYSNCTVMDLESQAQLALGYYMDEGATVSINNCLSQAIFGRDANGFTITNCRDCNCNNTLSNTIVNNKDSGGTAIGHLLRDSNAVSLSNCLSTFTHAVTAAASQAVGFNINNSNDIYCDFCTTTSTSASATSSFGAKGFFVNNAGNIVLERCSSSYNSEDAFQFDITSTHCLIGNCIATHSERGFVDFSSTNTFYNNVASKNTVANYVSVPFTVTQGSATIAGGNLDL